MSTQCIFCKIARKEIPSQIVFENDDVLAFDDLNPQAPVHVLVIPKRHIDHLDQAASGNEELLAKLMSAASAIANAKGIAGAGYRVVTNIGKDGGQTVGHLHLHILGGRAMNWPPG